MQRRNEDILVKRLAKNQLWIWVILILLFIGVSLFGSNNQPKEYPPYVSHSPSPTGTKALYTYLNEADFSVKRWKHEPHLLVNEGDHQLLLMIEPMSVPSSKQLYEYEQFMKRGNSILLFSNRPEGLFNIKTTFPTDIFSEAEDEEMTYNDRDYEVNIHPFEQLVLNDDDEALLYDDLGNYAMKRDYGDGSLIVVHDANMLLNGRILEEDHAELVIAFIEDYSYETKSILFDEFVHDSQFATSFINSYPFWFLVIIFQGMIVTLVWLFYKGKRFGPIFTPREDSVRFSDEGITALASWYMRAKRYQDSLHIQADYVKHLLQEHWRIPYKSSWKDIKPLLERRWQSPPMDIDQFVDELEIVLAEQSINKGQYIQWSKTLDELRKEVEEG